MRSGTIEPQPQYERRGARALTAFLMTQKGSGKQEAKN